MINCLIIDDNKMARTVLRHQVEAVEFLNLALTNDARGLEVARPQRSHAGRAQRGGADRSARA